MKLSEVQQRKILNSATRGRRNELKRYCRVCEQKGDGMKEILKKIGAFLGPIAKDVGPKVLKEFVIPLLIKKAKEQYGLGLSPAGGGLKLAGQGVRRGQSPWIIHCKKVARDNNMSYKDAMKVASKSYKK